MAIRKYLILILIIFSGCDPVPKKTFIIKNNSNEMLSFELYDKHEGMKNVPLQSRSEDIIFTHTGKGGDFGIVSGYDSIKMITKDTIYLWIKPDHPYGYINEPYVGSGRNIYLDFYNRKDWVEKIDDNKESWTFVITDTVLENLFED